MAAISASFAWEPGRNTFGTANLQRRLSTTLDALDLMLHPKQGVARDTRTTEVLYGGAAGTTVPAVRRGARCRHNARSASLRGCRGDGNDSLDFHPRRRAPRAFANSTSISAGIDFGMTQLDRAPYKAHRRSILLVFQPHQPSRRACKLLSQQRHRRRGGSVKMTSPLIVMPLAIAIPRRRRLAAGIVVATSRPIGTGSLQLQHDCAFRDSWSGHTSFAGILGDPLPCCPSALVGTSLVLVDRDREPSASGAHEGIAHETL